MSRSKVLLKSSISYINFILGAACGSQGAYNIGTANCSRDERHGLPDEETSMTQDRGIL